MKTGGRKKGVPNKKTKALQDEVAATGETPLAFMLRVMRDPKKPWADRMDMAKSSAPYVHARLASIEVAGTGRDGALLVQMVPSDAAL
jgi:hypothetical protein